MTSTHLQYQVECKGHIFQWKCVRVGVCRITRQEQRGMPDGWVAIGQCALEMLSPRRGLTRVTNKVGYIIAQNQSEPSTDLDA